jgi:catechol 2,3-dioxygenase-like lactoylglutathione lyase family enzyme
MLNSFAPVPTLPTADLDAAKTFYEGLGFSSQEMAEGVTFTSGDGGFFVYQSAYAGTNQATAMMFPVAADEFDSIVAALRDKGVTFDTFEMEGMVWEGDVMVVEDMKSVWFHDPDGNIVNIGTMT